MGRPAEEDPLAFIAIELGRALDAALLAKAGLSPFAGSILDGIFGKLTEDQQGAVITVFGAERMRLRKVVTLLDAWLGESFPDGLFRPFRWVRIRPESPRATHAINIDGTFHSFNEGSWYSYDSMHVVEAVRNERDERGNLIFEIVDREPEGL